MTTEPAATEREGDRKSAARGSVPFWWPGVHTVCGSHWRAPWKCPKALRGGWEPRRHVVALAVPRLCGVICFAASVTATSKVQSWRGIRTGGGCANGEARRWVQVPLWWLRRRVFRVAAPRLYGGWNLLFNGVSKGTPGGCAKGEGANGREKVQRARRQCAQGKWCAPRGCTRRGWPGRAP